jgi:hypothetical protein
LYAVAEAVPMPPAPAQYPSQQKWTWAVQQIMRVAQQARDPED